MKCLNISKRNTHFLLIATLTFIVTNCNGLGQFGGPGRSPRHGMQLEIELGQPIHIHESVPVTITLETEEDMSDIEVFMTTSDPDIQILGDSGPWLIDAVAHRPTIFTTNIEFTNEGYFGINAFAKDTKTAGVVQARVSLQVTAEGVTINPPPDSDEGLAEAVQLVEGEDGSLVTATASSSLAPEPTTPSPPPILEARASVGQVNLPIPDDGTWATLPLTITNIPAKAQVSEVSAKFLIAHPQGQELVVELVGPDGSTTQHLWNRETVGPNDLYESLLYRNTPNIDVFNGLPVAGAWHLRVKDEVAGQNGVIDSFSLIIRYELPPISGSPPEVAPAESPLPEPSPPPEPLPDENERRPGATPPEEKQPSNESGMALPRENPSTIAYANIETQGTWTTITSQGFEGVFPNSGWSAIDLTGTGFQRFWDDDDYRPHTGSWAAWPANGGSNAIYPVPGNDNYPNDMNARMTYGPFDLSGVAQARVSFYLWIQTEANFDYLVLEASGDGAAFQELSRWDGSAGWQKKTIYLNNYTGDSSVWLAWRFVSDYSITYDGPWVDDILIEKELPGQVTARGYYYYYDRNNVLTPVRWTPVYLYDSDPSGNDDYLGSGTTNDDGYWQIGPVTNQDDPGNSTLDLYAVWKLNTTRRTVTYPSGTVYGWSSGSPRVDVADGVVDFGSIAIGNNSQEEGAMWIFQDMRRAWAYPWPADPGSATVRWQRGATSLFPCIDDSCFWPYPSVNGVFILDGHEELVDTVVHELGHAYMYNFMDGNWFWTSGQWGDLIACLQHSPFQESNQLCAWMEGWADFYALAVNNELTVNDDPCRDYASGSCGTGSVNFETPTWDTRPKGDRVEGRVTGALWDIYDIPNDGFDRTLYGFDEIWDTVTHWQLGGTGTPYNSFHDFWIGWIYRGYNLHDGVTAIYQNTIDYNEPPVVAVPDYWLPLNNTQENAFRLWNYTLDFESADSQLTYTLLNVSDPNCGVSLDTNAYIDIYPTAGWLGSCQVTVRAMDFMGEWGDDTFQVTVWEPTDIIYLPVIMKGS